MARPDGAPTPPPGSADADEIAGQWAPARRASVASVEVDGEGVLLDEASGSMQLLDPLATVIWALFDGSTTLDELVVDLSEVFGAEAEQVRSDVWDLVRNLRERDLLQPAHAAPAPEGGDPPPAPSNPSSDAAQPRFLERPGST